MMQREHRKKACALIEVKKHKKITKTHKFWSGGTFASQFDHERVDMDKKHKTKTFA